METDDTVDIEVEIHYEAQSIHRLKVSMADALSIADDWDVWLQRNYDKTDRQKGEKLADLLCSYVGEWEENYLDDWCPDPSDEVIAVDDVRGYSGRSTCNEAALVTFQKWLNAAPVDLMQPTPGQLDIFGNEVT